MTGPTYDEAAERSVVGAILNAGSLDVAAGHRVLDRVYGTGLEPHDFYIDSLGRLFGCLVRMRVAGMPLDAVSVADELDRQADATLHERARLEQLAHEVTAITPAAHWARIVTRDARRRRTEPVCR